MVSVNISVVLFSVRLSKWENICVANFHAINFHVKTHFAEVDCNEKVLRLRDTGIPGYRRECNNS